MENNKKQKDNAFWEKVKQVYRTIGRAQATAVTFIFYWLILGPFVFLYKVVGVRFVPKNKFGTPSFFRERKPASNERERFLRQF